MNGYRWAWRTCIRSQRRYAARFGFDYVCVDPPWTIPPADAAWLKLALLARVLERGHYAWTLFVDADAEVRAPCPDFRRSLADDCDVGLAAGHSGRPNSGVIVVRRGERSLAFVRAVLADHDGAVAPADAAPYENGHVIKHAPAHATVGRLERRWNNTLDPNLDDWIRHYTGPMRTHAPAGRRAVAAWRRLATWRGRIAGDSAPARDLRSLGERLERMTAALAQRYPVFDAT